MLNGCWNFKKWLERDDVTSGLHKDMHLLCDSGWVMLYTVI